MYCMFNVSGQSISGQIHTTKSNQQTLCKSMSSSKATINYQFSHSVSLEAFDILETYIQEHGWIYLPFLEMACMSQGVCPE